MWSNQEVQVELRIHGVSGTPPSRMLDAEVEPDERFPGNGSTVWKPRGGDGSLLAYRWASKTSGTARSAMWLLLVPYMLVNVAGWALPPTGRPRHRAAVAATRVSGLLLTLVFSLVTAVGVIGVGAYRVLHVERGWDWQLALTLGTVVATVVMGALWFSSSKATGARNDRDHLRLPHVAVAAWGVWATAVTVGGVTGDVPRPIGSMWLLPAALALLLAAGSLWEGLESVTSLFGGVAIVGAAALTVSAVLRYGAIEPAAGVGVDAFGAPLRGAVIAYTATAILTVALAWTRSHPDSGPLVATLLAAAGSSGAAVGAGAVVAAAAMFGTPASATFGGFADGFLVGLTALVAFTGIHAWTHAEPAEEAKERLLLTLTSFRDDLRPLLVTIPALSVGIGAVVIAGRADVLTWLAAAAAASMAVTTAGACVKMGLRWWALLGPALAGGGYALVLVTSFRTVGVAVSLLAPFFLVLTRIVGAIGDERRRRLLAIPWDIGSFFSRRFHPFAPPTYRDSVERELKTVVCKLRGDGDDVIVSGHSQGSVVGAATLHGMRSDDLDLLTYGSPFGPLYMRFFPVSFPPDVVAAVGARRWINLWRPTDPIGGPIPGGVDDRRVPDTRLRGHAHYWAGDEPAFRRALDDLRPGISSEPHGLHSP